MLVCSSLAAVLMLGVADWGGAGSVHGDAAHASAIAPGSTCPLAATTMPDAHGTVPAPASPGGAGAGALPPDVSDATLRALHARLALTPGFVDVHFMLDGSARFVAWFAPDASLPTQLGVADAPYPVVAMHMPLGLASLATDAAAEADAVDPPLVPGPCGDYRPGTQLPGSACTMAWQLKDELGRLYVATAGHCLPMVGSSFPFGTAVFKRADGIGADFGLIRVDDLVAPGFEPAMCHWGGPTMVASDGGPGDVVRLYGQGLGFGAVDATRPRSGVLQSVGAESFTYAGPVMSGDSGAPVATADGAALGVHTHGLNGFGPATLPTTTPTIKWGMRLDVGIELAEAELGVDLTLVTAPLA